MYLLCDPGRFCQKNGKQSSIVRHFCTQTIVLVKPNSQLNVKPLFDYKDVKVKVSNSLILCRCMGLLVVWYIFFLDGNMKIESCLCNHVST